jgi:hypothetical protein
LKLFLKLDLLISIFITSRRLIPTEDIFVSRVLSHQTATSFIKSCLHTVIEGLLRASVKLKLDPTAEAVLCRIVSLYALAPEDVSLLLGDLGALSSEPRARLAVVKALKSMLNRGFLTDTSVQLEATLSVLTCDSEETVRNPAIEVAKEKGFVGSYADVIEAIYPLLSHPTKNVRISAARALVGCVAHGGVELNSVLQRLFSIYTGALPVEEDAGASSNFATGKLVKPLLGKGELQPIGKGAIGKSETASTASLAAGNSLLRKSAVSIDAPLKPKEKIVDDPPNKVAQREAVAECLLTFGSSASRDYSDDAQAILAVFDFVLQRGVVDPNADVRSAMLTAGRALVDAFGPRYSGLILQRLEALLSPSAKASQADEDVKIGDTRRGAAVVLLGAAGKHLSKDENPTVMLNIVDTLIGALDTPSESIQRAVADCLAPLIQAIKGTSADYIAVLVDKLTTRCLNGDSYGIRRGAAFGLSATVKGLGVPSLKQFDLINKLKDACTSGSVENREGSLCAFELLSDRLGLLFEPYVISIVPILLKCFSHASNHVRDAAQV